MTKHGHGLPRKRPGRSAKKEIDAELPELEPALDDLQQLEEIEVLPTLEPLDGDRVDEGPVKATCSASDEPDFDMIVTVDVPEMPKKDVGDAVEAPLSRIATASADAMRHQRVLVRFTGDALIGSAVKDLVAATMKPHKPVLVVVRRGFGDEKVHEGRLPTVEVSIEKQDGVANVQVATGDIEGADLPVAMMPHMAALAESARDMRVVFQFGGGARPDATMRDAITMALRDAGAKSAAIGARVLFDRELEERIKCFVSGNKATITVALTDDDASTVDALSLVLPSHQAELDGKNVRFQFARESSAVQAFCVDFAKSARAVLVEVGGSDDTDIVWPPLIRVVKGKETTLRLEPNGRSRAAVLAAFARECAEHHTETQGKNVVVDWPGDFALDTDVEQCLAAAMNQVAPKRLCCTIGGEHREPFVPEPMHMVVDGELHILRVDSEVGKPRELQRALDRRLPPKLADLRGEAVRIEIIGEVAMSRTLVRSLCGTLAEAGVMRLEVAEGGNVDVLLPPMLALVQRDSGISITAVAGGRDEAQQQLAVVRELEGVELPLQSVTIGGSAADIVAHAVLEQGASRVVLDGPEPIQVHPPLFEIVEKIGREARFVVEPTGDVAMDARMLEHELPRRLGEVGMLVGTTVTIVWPGADPAADPLPALVETLRGKQPSRVLLDAGGGAQSQLYPEPEPEPEAVIAEPAATESQTASTSPAAAAAPAVPAPAAGGSLISLLGRRDESIPPLVLLGVAASDDPGYLTALEAELQGHLPRFAGRAVLLVPQQGSNDVPVRKPNALVQMLARVVPTGAAATLVFRGPDSQGRPHFQVLHSSLRALPVGGAFGDPRASRQSS